MDGFRVGSTLVVVTKNGTSRRQIIDPSYAPLLAAMLSARGAMTDALLKASEARPTSQPLTEEQRNDWMAFIAKHGEAFRVLTYQSSYDIIESGLAELGNIVNQAHANPAVQEAWEHYKFLVALANTEEKS